MTGINKEKIKDYYNNRYKKGQEKSFRPTNAFNIYLNYLDVKKEKKLLDVACGAGYLLKIAESRGLETYGVDISEEAIKIAKKIAKKSKIMVDRGEKLEYSDNFFDYVFCIGSLEHFLDMDKGIKEMVRVSKENAKICIVVPNINFLLWKFKKDKGTEQRDIIENLLSLEKWQDILKNNGLIVNEIFKDEPILRNKVKQIIMKLLNFVLPLHLTYQFIFICSRNNLKNP